MKTPQKITFFTKEEYESTSLFSNLTRYKIRIVYFSLQMQLNLCFHKLFWNSALIKLYFRYDSLQSRKQLRQQITRYVIFPQRFSSLTVNSFSKTSIIMRKKKISFGCAIVKSDWSSLESIGATFISFCIHSLDFSTYFLHKWLMIQFGA